MNAEILFQHSQQERSLADDSSITFGARSADEEPPLGSEHMDEAHFYQMEQEQLSQEPRELAEHACSYCGIQNTLSVVKCETCNKWFCNSKVNGGRSHIVTHLILSRHSVVSLHGESELGDTTLECYSCGNRNVFLLGFTSAKQQNTVVILCRLPCAQKKDNNWDTKEWQPLIEDRLLLPWIAQVPTEEDKIYARELTSKQIVMLESKWRSDKTATVADLDTKDAEEEEVLPILMRYNDAYEYQRSFGPLVKSELDYDKLMKESQSLERISVKWGLGLNKRHTLSFALSSFESGGMKITVHDEIILHYNEINDVPWKGRGYIVSLPDSHSEEFVVELRPSKEKPPIHATTGFTAEFVWKGVSYERMQTALRNFAVNPKSASAYIYHKLLGHEVPEIEFDVDLPSNFDIPGFLTLNSSQKNAVKTVLQKPLSLIQGPPGTGKTVTSLTIVYHLARMNDEKILVCAPSNVAVDHLAVKLDALGLKTVRIFSKGREDVGTIAGDLLLHSSIKNSLSGVLKKLLKLKEEVGELTAGDTKKFLKLINEAERKLIKNADVICTTCVGLLDSRLKGMSFKTVLIDESTQLSEPECLIPIVRGAKQVVLVGDHQQLGPVILDRKAADAGLKQSLFERLIILGHIPIRLEVQYRMNPHLSEFPSNMFYEGSLQNGVTTEQRALAQTLFPWPIHNIPMMFWSNYGREEISSSGTSFLNRVELMNCDKIVTNLFNAGIKPSQIGVITPYEGQRTFIVQYMQLNGATLDKSLYEDVEVASVDAFQGREKDFIIFSCVRANDRQFIGFLSDPRRLNVALTRLKYGLIILGNPKVLCKNALWNHLLNHFREKGCLVEGQLENLQLCTIQLRRPEYVSNYTRDGGIGSERDTDTESLASFSSFAPPSQHNGYSSNNGMPPKFQWPSLGVGAPSETEYDDADAKSETNNATVHDGQGQYFGSDNVLRIDSSFSTKLQQINAQSNENRNVQDDIASLTSSFAAGLGMR